MNLYTISRQLTRSCLSSKPKELYIPYQGVPAFVGSISLAQQRWGCRRFHATQNVKGEPESAFNEMRLDGRKVSKINFYPTRDFIDSVYVKLLEPNGKSSTLLNKLNWIGKIVFLELCAHTSISAIGLGIIHKLSLLLPDLSEATINLRQAFQPIHEQSIVSNANVACTYFGLIKRSLMSFPGILMRIEPWACQSRWRLGVSEREEQALAFLSFDTDHHLFPAAAELPRPSNISNQIDGLSQREGMVDLHTKFSHAVATSVAHLPADAVMETADKLAFQHGSTRDEQKSLDEIKTSYNNFDSTVKPRSISLSRRQCKGIDHDSTWRFLSSDSHRVHLALGSNLGDRVSMIERACQEMDRVGIRVLRTSCLYETEPMYVLDQQPFINGVCEVDTILEPIQLLDQLKRIEDLLGREQTVDKGPRKIDLDILLFDESIIDQARLTVPHKAMLEREFVLRPLCDLIPNAKLPAPMQSKSFCEHLRFLETSGRPLSPMTPVAPNFPPILSRSPTRKTHLMAILNLTPDSFSDGGLHPSDPASLLPTLQTYLSAGMTILDIGGQSTRPRALQVSPEEELSRVIPAIKFIRTQPAFDNVAISIDTYRAYVAKAAIEAGANIVNDVSAGCMDPDMLSTVASLGCTIILMHMRGTPETMMNMTSYSKGVLAGVGEELERRVQTAEKAGIRRWRIVLDPGVGFAKDLSQNLELLRRLGELREVRSLQRLPWLVGTSRKGFIGKITGEKDPADRVWGTAGAVAAAIQGGADIVRVHDVKEMSKVIKMADAIWRTETPTLEKRLKVDTKVAGKDQKVEEHKSSVPQGELSIATMDGRSNGVLQSPGDAKTRSTSTMDVNTGGSGSTKHQSQTDANAAEIAVLTSSTPPEPLPQLGSIRTKVKTWKTWAADEEDAVTEKLTGSIIDSQSVLLQEAGPRIEMPISDLDAAEISALSGSNPSQPLLQSQSMIQGAKPEDEAWKRWTSKEDRTTPKRIKSSAADPSAVVPSHIDQVSEVPISDLDAAEISSLPGFRAPGSRTEASTDPSDPSFEADRSEN